jgi:hypothetical protein
MEQDFKKVASCNFLHLIIWRVNYLWHVSHELEDVVVVKWDYQR